MTNTYDTFLLFYNSLNNEIKTVGGIYCPWCITSRLFWTSYRRDMECFNDGFQSEHFEKSKQDLANNGQGEVAQKNSIVNKSDIIRVQKSTSEV